MPTKNRKQCISASQCIIYDKDCVSLWQYGSRGVQRTAYMRHSPLMELMHCDALMHCFWAR